MSKGKLNHPQNARRLGRYKIGTWYFVEYVEKGTVKYAKDLVAVGKLVGLKPLSARTYISTGEADKPRQAVHPDTNKVELVKFGLVDMAKPLPNEVKKLIAACA